MSKKPNFSTAKEKRLFEAKQELENELTETSKNNKVETIQTTLILEARLHYDIKKICLERKKAGIKPNTLTGMVKKALQDIVEAEKEDY